MKIFRKKPSESEYTRVGAFEYRPVKNVQVREETLDSGEVLLSYPVTMRPWFARLTRRLGGPEEPVRFRRLQLDELGTAVWHLLDGKRTVRQVIRVFSKAHQLHRREAETSVTQFLRTLGKRGIIGLK
jgi:hypothetical protein